jgi:hypothetical protein
MAKNTKKQLKKDTQSCIDRCQHYQAEDSAKAEKLAALLLKKLVHSVPDSGNLLDSPLLDVFAAFAAWHNLTELIEMRNRAVDLLKVASAEGK